MCAGGRRGPNGQRAPRFIVPRWGSLCGGVRTNCRPMGRGRQYRIYLRVSSQAVHHSMLRYAKSRDKVTAQVILSLSSILSSLPLF